MMEAVASSTSGETHTNNPNPNINNSKHSPRATKLTP